MNLTELKKELAANPANTIRFVLPGGDSVPSHAHVTEVARIDKRFIDCGGTLRNDSLCRLQTWFSDDTDHRLTAGKLLKILDKAGPILQSDDLEVDIEHEVGVISQFPLLSARVRGDDLVFELGTRHTTCLAEDKCKSGPVAAPGFNPRTLEFTVNEKAGGCCGGK